MTRTLQALVCPRVALVLEGGYDVAVLSRCVCACVRALLGDQVSEGATVKPKREARLSLARTLRAHRHLWKSLCSADEESDLMTLASISMMTTLTISGWNATGVELASVGVEQGSLHQLRGQHQLHGQLHLEACASSHRSKRHPKHRHVKGVAISTRNAAEANWKGDVKKLMRRQGEIQATLQNIEFLRCNAGCGVKVSRKSCALMGEEDELRWQLEEIESELQELTSLTKADAVRMYAGCG